MLFNHAVVAVDGSKFKAVNNRDRTYIASKVAKRIEQVKAKNARSYCPWGCRRKRPRAQPR
jgi:hypothetical protein